jgi:hypothetical protein
MIIIFEDKIDLPEQKYIGLSYMMQHTFDNSKVIFAESNDRIKGKILAAVKQREQSEEIVAFVDLVADNHNTWGIYESLVKTIIRDGLYNVYVIPIACSEHIFNMAFNNYITDRAYAEVIAGRGKYKHLINCKSFEKFCKKALRLYKDESIYINVVDEDNYSFYSCDTYKYDMSLSYDAKLSMVSKELAVCNIMTQVQAVDILENNFKIFLNQVKTYEEDDEYNTWDTSIIENLHQEYMTYLSR